MSLRIRNLADEQVNEVCALFYRVFSVQVTPAAWRWKYAAEYLQGAINLVAYDADHELVGHAGAVILAGVDEGRPRAMVQICDVMVAGHRRGGLGSVAVYPALMRALRAEINARFPGAYAYGFPGERPFLLGERLGFYRRAYDISEMAMQALVLPKSFWHWPKPALREIAWDSSRKTSEALNRLWARLAPSAGSPAVVRGADYVFWRYAQHPTRRYTLLMQRHAWLDTAWWVVAAEGEALRIVDGLCAKQEREQALSVLADWAAQQGFMRLLCWHPESCATEAPGNTGIVAMQFVLGSDANEPMRKPRFMPGDLDVF